MVAWRRATGAGGERPPAPSFRGVLAKYFGDAMRSVVVWARRQLAGGSVDLTPPLPLAPQPATPAPDSWCGDHGSRGSGDSASEACVRCNRFRSRASSGGELCAYHDVSTGLRCETATTTRLAASYSCRRLLTSLKMWLKSIVGANIDDDEASVTVIVIDSFMCFAESFRNKVFDPFRFCEESLGDYRLVHRFLEREWDHYHQPEHMRAAIKGLRHFIVFRKFHQPVKGIIANPYAASEKLLESYLNGCSQPQAHPVLRMLHADTDDLDRAVRYHEPKYRLIVSLLTQANDVHSLESGQDLEFATSFLCCYLSRLQPLRIGHLSRLLLSDLDDIVCQREGPLVNRVERRRNLRFATRHYFDDRGLANKPEHRDGIVKGGKIKKRLKPWERESRNILSLYMHQVHPRLSKTNDLLLLSSEGLGLRQHTIRRKISMLIYEALGKEVAIGDDIQGTS